MRFNCRNDLRWFLIRMLVILAPVTISGCVETLSSRHITAKQALLGKSESEVLACAEAPRTVSSQDRLRVLSYYKEGGLLEGSFPGTKGSRPEGVRHPAPNHSNRMLLNEDAMTTGIAMHAAIATTWLARAAAQSAVAAR